MMLVTSWARGGMRSQQIQVIGDLYCIQIEGTE
jgi:hypothetical protein